MVVVFRPDDEGHVPSERSRLFVDRGAPTSFGRTGSNDGGWR